MITSTSDVARKKARTICSPDHSITLTTRTKTGKGKRANSKSSVTRCITNEHGVALDIP